MDAKEEKQQAGRKEQLRDQINLNPIRRFIERSIDHPERHLEPYVTKGQVVADLARASSAGDLGFIQDGSVDFVLANGLL